MIDKIKFLQASLSPAHVMFHQRVGDLLEETERLIYITRPGGSERGEICFQMLNPAGDILWEYSLNVTTGQGEEAK